VPAKGTPTFSLAEDEIEFGVGIHGEPGIAREKLPTASQLAERMVNQIVADVPFVAGKEVGGADMKIVAYSRETSSGTYEFFKESVLKNKNYMNGILSMPATGAIIQSVSQTKGAIGYVGLAYINKEVKPIHVSYDAGKTFTEPSFENAKNKAYPIVRPLFYYYDVKNEGKVKPFIDYILSAEGQATVKQVGYIPVK
jgi:phosphate transport system substrate-binding protein